MELGKEEVSEEIKQTYVKIIMSRKQCGQALVKLGNCISSVSNSAIGQQCQAIISNNNTVIIPGNKWITIILGKVHPVTINRCSLF